MVHKERDGSKTLFLQLLSSCSHFIYVDFASMDGRGIVVLLPFASSWTKKKFDLDSGKFNNLFVRYLTQCGVIQVVKTILSTCF